MATTRKTAAKPPVKPDGGDEAEDSGPETPPAQVDQGIVRGGWDVGYRGTRVDDTPDEAYSVTGVLKTAKSEK